MKKLVLALVVLVGAYYGLNHSPALRQLAGSPSVQATGAARESYSSLLAAIRDRRSGTQVSGEGRVTKLLADDNDGSRHQRFLLTIPSGQSLLVAHNIDLAPRLARLKTGDSVAFNGVYEWNAKGGLIHWTHRDPGGRHQAGWLKHSGQTYQ